MCACERMKNGFHKFCDGTSFHGYAPLYYTKSKFWLYFWILCTSLAAGITLYQVIGTVSQYMDQESSTTIRIAKDKEIIYPPLKLCYSHWLQWVDFDKAYAMNFTKESLLYGLSYLTRIYSIKLFNVTEARFDFNKTLEKNNITNITSFYHSISKIAPLNTWGEYRYDDSFYNRSIFENNYFTHTEFTTFQMDNPLFCHFQTGEEIRKIIKEEKSTSKYATNENKLIFSISDLHAYKDDDPFLKEITMREYNSYMAEWIQYTTPQYWIDEYFNFTDYFDTFRLAKRNYTNFDTPLVLFPEGYTNAGVKLPEDIDEVYITVKASVHVWKNTKASPCDESKISIVSDNSCQRKCMTELETLNDTSAYLGNVFFIDKFDIESLKTFNIYFINESQESQTTTTDISLSTESLNNNEEMGFANISAHNLSMHEPVNLTVTEIKKISDETEICKKKCLQGCTRWNFDVSVTYGSIFESVKNVSQKLLTNVQIAYPLDGDIMMMVETDSQTWENFVGSVGGLLGIWTGASILSFIEMIYLCCFTDSEGPFNHISVPRFIKRRQALHGRRKPVGIHIKRVKTIIIPKYKNIAKNAVANS